MRPPIPSMASPDTGGVEIKLSLDDGLYVGHYRPAYVVVYGTCDGMGMPALL